MLIGRQANPQWVLMCPPTNAELGRGCRMGLLYRIKFGPGKTSGFAWVWAWLLSSRRLSGKLQVHRDQLETFHQAVLILFDSVP